MKVIVLGSTGFIGKEVFQRCLKDPAITSLIALSRRDLPEAATNPKLTVVIIDNFKSYPDSVLEQLKYADACIWSIGTYNWDPVVEIEYPEAFQKALLTVLDVKKTFRYVYLGGAFTEPDQEKNLWLFAEGRHVRGIAQTKFLEFGKQNQNVETYVVKPAAVLAKGAMSMLRYVLGTWSVRVEDLAIAMVDLAVNGGSGQLVLTKAIVERARVLLEEEK